MKFILDTNIYNCLDADVEACTLARDLVNAERMIVIVTRTIAQELRESPFRGIPDFFPTKYEGNTVARCGIARVGDSLGSGEVFDAHLGNSKNVNDALIADAAGWKADWLVTEDKRLRRRFAALPLRCKPMSYGEFRALLVACGARELIDVDSA